jgi:adenylate kinase family enzyme
LNLKVCFIGYSFAGKKTQANRLKEEYGLNVFELNDLVKQSLEYCDIYPDSIEKQEEE